MTSDPSSVTIFKIIICWRNDTIVESEAENAHFQPSEWGFLTTKHSPRFENDGALALREKIAAGMAGFSRRKPPLSGLRELAVEI